MKKLVSVFLLVLLVLADCVMPNDYAIGDIGRWWRLPTKSELDDIYTKVVFYKEQATITGLRLKFMGSEV